MSWFDKGQVVSLDRSMTDPRAQRQWCVMEEDLGTVLRVWTFGDPIAPIRQTVPAHLYEVAEEPGVKGLDGLAIWLVQSFGASNTILTPTIPVNYFKDDQHTLAQIFVYGQRDDSNLAFAFFRDDHQYKWAMSVLTNTAGPWQNPANRAKRLEALRSRLATSHE